jgi:hypothetical protein
MLLTCGGFTATTGTDTTISGTSSTTTRVDVTDATTGSVGGCITVAGETRYITAVDTTSTPNNFTVDPPLNTAPTTAGVAVVSGIAYKPNSDSDTTPSSATLWLSNNAHMLRIQGAFATAFTVSLGGTEAGRLQMTVTGKSFDYRGTSTLTSGIDNSTTTVPVANAHLVPADVSASNPYYFTISAGLAVEEFVQVTAKSGSDLTVVRASPSGSASAHDSGATIEPYVPVPTYAGSPVPSTGGDTIIDSVTTRASASSFAVDLGRMPEENVHGSQWVVDGYSNGMRTITATYEAFSDNATTGMEVQSTYDRNSAVVFTQQGEATGAVICAYAPAIYLEVPEFAFSPEDMKWSMTGEANTSTVGADDELTLLHG